MAILSSLHVHSIFCDGKDNPIDIVGRAISIGFKEIGFSSHNHTGYSFDTCGIREDKVEEYFCTISHLKDMYKGRISVFTGLEMESRTKGEVRPKFDSRLDYSIGSVHIFRAESGFYSVDDTPEEWIRAKKAFNDDTLSLIESYLEELTSYAEDSPFDIVGHFDLYTKFNEKCNLFDENDPLYKSLALSYLDRIAKTGKIFEVNTGAMSRGWKTIPYPASFLLERILELKSPIIVTSDSHSVDTLDYGYEETRNMLLGMGFKMQRRLTDNGWVDINL